MKKLFPLMLLAVAFAFASCSDDDDNRIPVTEAYKSFINSKYPGAIIHHAEHDKNGYVEVEITHDGHRKDVYFNSADEWVVSMWDVSLASLPEVVKNAISATYPTYTLDEADYIQRPTIEYYEVEIRKGGFEQLVLVAPDGMIITKDMI